MDAYKVKKIPLMGKNVPPVRFYRTKGFAYREIKHYLYRSKLAYYRYMTRNRYKAYLRDTDMNFVYGVTPEETGFDTPPNGCVKNCTRFPCVKCDYYYGEIHECMYGEIAE